MVGTRTPPGVYGSICVRRRGEGVSPLLLEEGKQETNEHADLADPKDEHPLDEAGSQVVHFRTQLADLSSNLGTELSYLFCQPTLEALSHHFNDRFFIVFSGLINQRDQGVGSFLSQLLTQWTRDSNNCHQLLLLEEVIA